LKDKKKRVYDQIPDSFFKIIGFGFPEDENMGSDSSESEEEMAKRQMENLQLNVDKIKKKAPEVDSPAVNKKEEKKEPKKF
jgi:hypothetical protein